jgi:cytochrome P450
MIKETIGTVIYKARQKLEQGVDYAKEPANFLEALLLAQDESGNGLSDSEILGNVLTILVAGEDTTAHTLAWLVYLISQHPKAQEKIQQEADAVLGESLIPQVVTDVDKLTYIEAVAHETLRLKSVAPLFFMEPNEEVELNNVTIPKGTFLMLLNRYGALRDENFSHALEFRPERWLEVNASGCVHNRNVSIPFGGGPRFCPGRNLALLEIKMAIATLCRNFSIIPVEGDQPVQEVFSFTMRPENLRVKLEAR